MRGGGCVPLSLVSCVIRDCLSEHQVGILFVLPFLITAATSSVWPVAEVIWLAYYQYDRLRYDAQF